MSGIGTGYPFTRLTGLHLAYGLALVLLSTEQKRDTASA